MVVTTSRVLPPRRRRRCRSVTCRGRRARRSCGFRRRSLAGRSTPRPSAEPAARRGPSSVEPWLSPLLPGVLRRASVARRNRRRLGATRCMPPVVARLPSRRSERAAGPVRAPWDEPRACGFSRTGVAGFGGGADAGGTANGVVRLCVLLAHVSVVSRHASGEFRGAPPARRDRMAGSARPSSASRPWPPTHGRPDCGRAWSRVREAGAAATGVSGRAARRGVGAAALACRAGPLVCGDGRRANEGQGPLGAGHGREEPENARGIAQDSARPQRQRQQAARGLHHPGAAKPGDGRRSVSRATRGATGRTRFRWPVPRAPNHPVHPGLVRMEVTVRVHEASVDKIKPGQRAKIVVEAFPDNTLWGVVTKASSTSRCFPSCCWIPAAPCCSIAFPCA